MTHSALRSEFEALIDVYAPVAQLGTGFTFTEGPIWHPVDHYLLFSDMPADVRRRWDARGGVREVRRPSNKHNGMTYDAELNLIVCEHATSSLVRERNGQREVLASHFEGRELNSPNDVCVRSTARSISPTHGTAACRSTAWSVRASSASRASIACRPAADSRSCWSSARVSSSRTGSPSRPTRRPSTSTTPSPA
jgi:sugar lactone lactonase YvrE